MKPLGVKLQRSLLLGAVLLASAGAHAVEKLNETVDHKKFIWDIWELCCRKDSGPTLECKKVGLRAQRFTIGNGINLKKTTTGLKLALKAKEEGVHKVWGSPPCSDFSAITNLNQKHPQFRKNLPRRRLEARAIVRNVVRIFKQIVLQGGCFYYEWDAENNLDKVKGFAPVQWAY